MFFKYGTEYNLQTNHHQTRPSQGRGDVCDEGGSLQHLGRREDYPLCQRDLRHSQGSVITAWVLEGHIVEIPGLGNIQAEVRAKAQSRAEDVTESDILRRKLLLTPTKEIKDVLNATPVRITCRVREGDEVKKSES